MNINNIIENNIDIHIYNNIIVDIDINETLSWVNTHAPQFFFKIASEYDSNKKIEV